MVKSEICLALGPGSSCKATAGSLLRQAVLPFRAEFGCALGPDSCYCASMGLSAGLQREKETNNLVCSTWFCPQLT